MFICPSSSNIDNVYQILPCWTEYRRLRNGNDECIPSRSDVKNGLKPRLKVASMYPDVCDYVCDLIRRDRSERERLERLREALRIDRE